MKGTRRSISLLWWLTSYFLFKQVNKANVFLRLTPKTLARALPIIWFSHNFLCWHSSWHCIFTTTITNFSWQFSPQALAQKGRLDAIFDPQTRKDLISRGRNDTCEFCGKVKPKIFSSHWLWREFCHFQVFKKVMFQFFNKWLLGLQELL